MDNADKINEIMNNTSTYNKEIAYHNNIGTTDTEVEEKMILYLKLHIANHRPG